MSRFFPPLERRTFWVTVIALLLSNWIIAATYFADEPRLAVPYSVFVEQVEDGNVTEVNATGFSILGEFAVPFTYTPTDGEATTGISFETEQPIFASDDGLLDLMNERGVLVNATSYVRQAPTWQVMLFSFGPTFLLLGLFFLIFKKFSGGGRGLSGFGRSRAKRYEEAENERVTFADVAGIDEAQAELVELVDFLRNPDKYARLGGRIPRGVLLSGPPGTGKTLLARAVAGEADVPFFTSSASEFIEMVVGVGASRVRDLFAEALELAPSIIFIDELDAIGRSRGSGSMGGQDEREQTLNQILTEMDGFSGSEGVIVLAATNRPEILDSALLRAGRFDRQVVVNPPDQAGRHAILGIHSRGVPLADDVDLDALASATPGMVGADLRNLVNEGALAAARGNQELVHMADLTNSLEKILLGVERQIVIDEDERERTAYHEAGHALLGMLQPGADPVRKISIIPRGRALGVTLQTPDSDRYGYDAAYLRGRIIGALGGRAAEEVIYGDVTTGAESDLQQVTNIARAMVGRWGMSDRIGPVAVLPPPGQESPFGNPTGASEQTMQLVDDEVRRIVDECYRSAITTLRSHTERLHSLAQALLERETLDEIDAYAAAGVPRRNDGASPEEVAVQPGLWPHSMNRTTPEEQ